MKRNALPALIAFAPALLLPLVQAIVRPRVPHDDWLGLVLSSAPNFVIGLCFPFSILIRPRAWSPRAAVRLFHAWAIITIVVLISFEYQDPLGLQTFDPNDIAASVAGVALALLVFHGLVRQRLTFASEGESR